MIAQSSAYRRSRPSDLVTFIFAFRRRVLKIPTCALSVIWMSGCESLKAKRSIMYVSWMPGSESLWAERSILYVI